MSKGGFKPSRRTIQTLYLADCYQLSGDLSPLASLTSLQSLDLTWCGQLSSDLSPLAGLTSLQSLNLAECRQLSDLTPLTGLSSLQTLHLSCCFGIRWFAPLESLLPTLKVLSLFGCKLNDLPTEVCGEGHHQNVLDKVRAHYADLEPGARRDAALKIFFLGNGGVGKTQLCRRLRDLLFEAACNRRGRAFGGK
jgi:Leucine-rich repeat (LRR) protein